MTLVVGKAFGFAKRIFFISCLGANFVLALGFLQAEHFSSEEYSRCFLTAHIRSRAESCGRSTSRVEGRWEEEVAQRDCT